MTEKYYVEVNDDGTYWYEWPGTDRRLHRTDGPAVEYSDGRREWRQHGILHRTDGPAVENANGYCAWWQNGHLHRTDGPAIEYAAGAYEWWFNGTQHTEESWRTATQPTVEMSVAEIESLLGKRIKIVK